MRYVGLLVCTNFVESSNNLWNYHPISLSSYISGLYMVLITAMARRVARNFDRGGKQQPSLNIQIYNALVFKSSSIKCSFFWHFFSEQFCSDLSRQIKSLLSLSWEV